MYFLKYTQKIPISLEKCWDFFSSPSNLKTITPSHLGFKITSEENAKKMYEGQIITYLIYPLLNIPIKWVTEITHIKELDYFIDEQRIGPYQFWHHEHHFALIPGGVEMIDLIYYQLPFGILGQALHFLKIKKDIEEIFVYRKIQIEKMFGPYSQPSTN